MITLKRNIGYKIGYCFAFFGTLLALGTSQSMPVGAQNANPASDFEYDLNRKGTGVFITKYKGNSKNVIIPSTIEDFPVVELKGAFANTNVESVVIPDSVTHLTSNEYLGCFGGCESLKKITLPKGLEYIDSYSFAYSGLESIRVPDSVVYMGKLAFSSCEQLKTVTIGNGVQVIDEYAFSECTALTTVNIGSGIKHIGSDAFGDCTALTSFNIGVAYLGNTDTDNSPTFEIELIESFELLYLERRPAQSHWFSQGYASDAFVGCTALSLKEKKKIRDSGYTGEFGSSKK